MKFIVRTYATCEYAYEVEADSLGEAEDRYYEGHAKELNEGNPLDIKNEQVDFINKVKIMEKTNG